MASRDNHQTTIDQHHVIHADAHGQQVVVGLRIEGPILVPFHRASALWRFHVQLAAVGANARPDQVCHDIQNFGVAQNIVIQRMLLGGIYQTAHAGRFRCMSWLQIKDICVLSEGCTLGHKFIGDAAQVGHFLLRENIFHRQKAIFGVRSDLLLS